MCGIAGILNFPGDYADGLARLTRMQQAIRHRGPDDEGIFIDANAPVGLVNTRLAILDLSPAGHQPMHSRDGRYTIVFNGEIYNFAALRARLEKDGVQFHSHSDTEVVLALYLQRGPACVQELQGMFALAIWDRDERTCFLARDPLGIKPLYYCTQGRTLGFASEVRALAAAEIVPRRLSRPGLQGYLLYGSVPEPHTIMADMQCLPAGHYLLWRDGQQTLTRYWELKFSTRPTDTDAAWNTREALLDSVRRHFVSDVPVGIFLSGGMDSTALVALAQQLHPRDLRTFCISFADPRFNEGSIARRTAEYFGTEHFDWRVDATTSKKLWQEYWSHLDQPSIDGFNTFCVAKYARECGAKVVLSGLGGDELFGGYPSFAKVPQLLKLSQALGTDGVVRQTALGLLGHTSTQSPKLQRLESFLSRAASSASAYWCVRGIFTPRETATLLQRFFPDDPVTDEELIHHLPAPTQPSLLDEVSYLELTRYMRNQLLRDSDVMSMAWGLELRVPFVDRQLTETLARIPASLRLAAGKQLLLQAVPEIPEWVARRPKQGFAFPFAAWIEAEWRDVFQRIDADSPVSLGNWYRRWSLFVLDNFLPGICQEATALKADEPPLLMHAASYS